MQRSGMVRHVCVLVCVHVCFVMTAGVLPGNTSRLRTGTPSRYLKAAPTSAPHQRHRPHHTPTSTNYSQLHGRSSSLKAPRRWRLGTSPSECTPQTVGWVHAIWPATTRVRARLPAPVTRGRVRLVLLVWLQRGGSKCEASATPETCTRAISCGRAWWISGRRRWASHARPAELPQRDRSRPMTSLMVTACKCTTRVPYVPCWYHTPSLRRNPDACGVAIVPQSHSKFMNQCTSPGLEIGTFSDLCWWYDYLSTLTSVSVVDPPHQVSMRSS